MTQAPVSSGSWHRVADLRPSLVPGLRIVRHAVRGEVWHMLVEPASGRQLRLNPPAYDLVGRFDGRETVTALWEHILELRGSDAPTQDEVLALLAQLFRGGVVQFDAAPHLSLLFARRTEEETRRRKATFLNPLMLRAGLGDPGPVLNRLVPLAGLIFNPVTFWIWLLAVLAGALGAAAHFGELKAHAVRLVDAPHAFVLAWIFYPAIKLLHEMAHGLAVRRSGGEVREYGVSLMFLVPAPYVDASAANAFDSSRARLVVSAAGIMVELGLAAIALTVWFAVSPGIVRDAAMVVFLIGVVSTIVFNANPLLRLDGYYILCDTLELPNLAARSQAWWLRNWMRWVAREHVPPDSYGRGERKWLIAYAPLSLFYRVLLLGALVAYAGSQSWLLGCTAAILIAGWLAGRAWNWLGAGGSRSKRAGIALAAVALVLLAIVPAPQSVVVQGVVWPPAPAQLRAQTAGFVDTVLVPDGAPVAAGEPVLRLDDPVLRAQRERVAAQEVGIRAEQYAAMLAEPADFLRLQADLDRVQAEAVRLDQQLAELDIRAGAPGRVAWSRPQDMPGTHARRGVLLGHVVVSGSPQVRLALPEEDFIRVRGRVESAEVVLAESPFQTRAGRLHSLVPGATHELPSAALGDRQGGSIPVETSDREGKRSRVPVFLFDVALEGEDAGRIGGRATVKLNLPHEPLLWQVVHRARQLLVRQFNPTGQL